MSNFAKDTNVHTNDCVSRQAAIDAICRACQYDKDDYTDCDDRAPSSTFCDYMNALRHLPSAQPEIILCRDCKYWLPHEQFGYDEDSEEYHDYCAKLVPEDEYYAFRRHADEWCSRAERRTDE